MGERCGTALFAEGALRCGKKYIKRAYKRAKKKGFFKRKNGLNY